MAEAAPERGIVTGCPRTRYAHRRQAFASSRAAGPACHEGQSSTWYSWLMLSPHPFQRRTLVHRDVVGLVALDFVLRVILAGVMRVPFVIDISGMHFDNLAADAAGLRVPGHMIADLEFGHAGSPRALD